MQQKIKKLFSEINKIYLLNFIFFISLLISIILNFFVTFRVEDLQDQIEKNGYQISSYRDQIGLLGVEWAYLTRPARLRELSSLYLKDNGYTLASQIINENDVDRYYETISF